MRVYFPYEKVRAEQQELIKDVAASVASEKIFLTHAPTGLGKTASTLAPALSYALENNKKVFFLTPKISQHEIVLETANLMNKRFELGIKTIDLVGRKQMCIDPFLSRVQSGFYEACAKRKKDKMCKYYTNTKGYTPKQKAIAIRRKREILTQYNNSYLTIKEQSMFSELCPYEITLEMIKNANLIVGDYSHLFHEDIRENVLGQSGIQLKDIILIVDEAHNLPERLRDMMSISFDLNAVGKAINEAKNIGSFETEFLLKDIEKEILNLGKKLSLNNSNATLELKDIEFLKKIARTNLELIEESAAKFMTKNNTENSFLLALEEFLYELLKEKEHTLYVIERKNSLGIGVYPLDPSEMASDILKKTHSAVLMSGTLLPLSMYSDVLGVSGVDEQLKKQIEEINKTKEMNSLHNNGFLVSAHEIKEQQKNNSLHNKESKLLMKEYKSPFPKENRLNLFVEKTTMKYTSRNAEQYNKIAQTIDSVISKIPGNTIVFFPSFETLESIALVMHTRRKILKQQREMSQDEKTKLVHEFKLLGSSFGGVLLAVSGGSISEGLDFPGDYLSCAIIVGVPFGRMDIYTNALIEFYEKRFHKGWEYAYNGTAITKAMQAAGRVIRTETDRGVCVFLDERFGESRFKIYYPKDFEFKKTFSPEKEVEEFFSKK
ncbi:MAG: ATP-dependent DNA helicase [archaeon]|jgi:DNA excision repair protein ERCC-2